MKRLAWYLVLIAMALFASAAALDRQAHRTPELSQYVPRPFRGFAAEQLAVEAIRGEQAAEALAISRQLLRNRPLPAEHLRLHAQAALLSGEDEVAAKALTLAGQRGWRDPITQFSILASAMQEGNLTVAAERLAAFLAMGITEPIVMAQASVLLADPAGREAFARRLASGGNWQAGFVGTGLSNINAADLVDTLARAERLGLRPPCTTLAGLSQQLDRARQLALATQVRGLRCSG